MTFPCKEDLVAIENIAKYQHNIFNDSCDIGVHVAEIADYQNFKAHIKNLIDFYGAEKTVCYGATTVNIAIPMEQDESFFDCIIVDITYYSQRKPHHSQITRYHNKNNSFLSFKFDRAMLTKESMKINYNSKIFDEKTNTYNSGLNVKFDDERTKKPELKDFSNCKVSK